MVGKSNRVCIRLLREDGSEAGFLDPGSLGKSSRLAEFFAEIFKGDNIILDEFSPELKCKMDELVSVAAQCIETLPPNSKFLQQLIYAATMHARTSIAQPKQGKLQKKVVQALNGYWESAAEALNGVKNFITCDDIAVPMERMLSMQQRSADQLQRLGSRVTALEIDAAKFKDDLARVKTGVSQGLAGMHACHESLSLEVAQLKNSHREYAETTDAQLDANVASSKRQAEALAAMHGALARTQEQYAAQRVRGAELEGLISGLCAQHKELEAREEAREREQALQVSEQALRVSELATALEQQKLLTAELSKKLAEITSLKLRDVKRQMERMGASLGLAHEHLRNDFAMLKQGLDMVQWEQARTEDGGLQLFATNEDLLALKQAVADLAAAKQDETSLAGGGATSDDPVDSFLAMAGTFLAAAEQQWAEPPPPTPEAGVSSLEVPEPLVEPIEGQEQLEVTTPPHPATLPPPIGLTVRPPPVEAGGQVDASPLPLSPPFYKKRGVLGQLSANLSRVFSPRHKPATPDADADAQATVDWPLAPSPLPLLIPPVPSQVAASAAVSTPPPQPPRGINPPDTGERDLALMGFE